MLGLLKTSPPSEERERERASTSITEYLYHKPEVCACLPLGSRRESKPSEEGERVDLNLIQGCLFISRAKPRLQSSWVCEESPNPAEEGERMSSFSLPYRPRCFVPKGQQGRLVSGWVCEERPNPAKRREKMCRYSSILNTARAVVIVRRACKPHFRFFFSLRLQSPAWGEKTPREHILITADWPWLLSAQRDSEVRESTQAAGVYLSLINSSMVSAGLIALIATAPFRPRMFVTVCLNISSVASSARTADTPRDRAAIS